MFHILRLWFWVFYVDCNRSPEFRLFQTLPRAGQSSGTRRGPQNRSVGWIWCCGCTCRDSLAPHTLTISIKRAVGATPSAGDNERPFLQTGNNKWRRDSFLSGKPPERSVCIEDLPCRVAKKGSCLDLVGVAELAPGSTLRKRARHINSNGSLAFGLTSLANLWKLLFVYCAESRREGAKLGAKAKEMESPAGAGLAQTLNLGH